MTELDDAKAKVANLSALYDKLSASTNNSYGVDGRSASKKTLAEVRDELKFWKGEVARLTNAANVANGGKNSAFIFVR
jgi:hypothetical protein